VGYEEGSLMIDFLTRPNLKLAWRGAVKEELSPVGQSDSQIRKTVARLLKKFPGKG